jgi:phosphoribosylaminoimidazolecarboxamide formyltransferase/IMP cyclohydrolase
MENVKKGKDDLVFIKRALISVSDKDRLDQLVTELHGLGVELIASGGTSSFIQSLGIPVTPLREVTGNPEAFGGRMKSLSFQVSSSLLFRRNNPDDWEEAASLGIRPIDLVVCNLYPFEKVTKAESSEDILIENIDIGGPTMIRAAAKNYQSVGVCTGPEQYDEVLATLRENKGGLPFEQRKKWALEAFRHTAHYDGMIAGELEERWGEEVKTISLSPKMARSLRYGENPHQKAWVYSHPTKEGLASKKPLQGKQLSYNNLLDADAAWKSASDILKLSKESFKSAVSIIKHSNPCGNALAKTSLEALKLAWAGDPVSSFGSIICFSDEVEEDVASWLGKKFVEVIVAPSFTKEALHLFSKKKNLRLIDFGPQKKEASEYCIRDLSGGWLVQTQDKGVDMDFKKVTKKKLPSEMLDLAQFGILATKHLKSNAIGLVYKGQDGLALAGGGMGNPNRLISLKEALEKAKENGYDDFSKMILISDAFFPFTDNIELAHDYGVQFIVQPGGSLRDNEVIKACDDRGMAMIMTGRRHFRH